MIENTLISVFDYVYVIPIPSSLNYILFASNSKLPLDSASYESDSGIGNVVRYCVNSHKEVEFDSDYIILTDDKAPVELFTDYMILTYASE